jgi:hypothetical protein
MQASNIDTLRLGISVMVLGYIGWQKSCMECLIKTPGAADAVIRRLRGGVA